MYYGDGISNNCSTAINGNTGTVYTAGNCINTADGDVNPSWTVDLGQYFTIQRITVYGRTGQEGRLRNLQVFVDSTVVFTFPGLYEQPETITEITPRLTSSQGYTNLPIRGRYVRLARFRNNTYTGYDALMLNICEVRVWVCKIGHYGLNCAQCRPVCANSSCDDITYPDTCPAYNPCDNNPCQNNGTCQRLNDTNPHNYTCLCPPGYTGTNCTQDIDECTSNPCVNGTCQNTDGSYNCTCFSGYTGQNCSIDIDDCEPSPCAHGQCTDHVANYSCTCDEGFSGFDCDYDIDECINSPCVNGSCQNTGGSYNCTCFSGYTGQNCSIDIDDCEPSPCAYGQCTDHVANYSCTCEKGFSGLNCDYSESEDEANNTLYIAIGTGVGAAALLILIIVVVVIVVRRRRHKGPARSLLTAQGEIPQLQSASTEDDEKPDSAQEVAVPDKKQVKPFVPSKPGHLHTAPAKDKEIEADAEYMDGSKQDLVKHLYGNIGHGDTPVVQDHLDPKIHSPSQDKEKKKNKESANQAEKDNSALSTSQENVYQNVDKAQTSVEVVKIITPRQALGSTPKTTHKEVSLTRVGNEGEHADVGDLNMSVDEEDEYNHEDLYACFGSLRHTETMMDEFQTWLLERLKSPAVLETEFQRFPKGMIHAHDAGMDPGNKIKNRFQKLCAYDKNRVVLKLPKTDHATDYINASWIKDLDCDRTYIATQGPRINTISDFWWMVWQENVTQIVMLSKLQEDGKDKCDEYWPDIGDTMTFGHVTVTLKTQDQRAHFTIRTLTLCRKEDKKTSRTVCQYHYVSWPDHGVPEPVLLVNFWSYITTGAHSSGPPVVHCSAGVGRTGTYIALDMALSRKSRGLDVNLFDIVMELREQRSIMVQTLVQYKFLHEVILEVYTSRNSRLTAEQLDLRFTADVDVNIPNKTIDGEFKTLTEMKAWAKRNHTTAKLDENKDKNRDGKILPEDDHLVFLHVPVKGRNQYINAVSLSSFRVDQGLLLTQLPLPHTLVDLWRLVEGCDVTTILSLGAKDDKKTIKNFCPYWPKTSEEDLTIDPYTLTLCSSLRVNDNITTYSVFVKHKGHSSSVNIVHYTDWSGELPGTIPDLMHLLTVVREASQRSEAPVIIQCLDGATRSGLFCVLYDVICQMTYDDHVDVFSAVRHVQRVRPPAVVSMEQYRFCYKVALEARRSRSTLYANLDD